MNPHVQPHPSLARTCLSALVLATFAANALAQGAPSNTSIPAAATVQQSPGQAAQTSEAPPTGVNPMTGRPLSEEELHRQLSKSKLVTQLGQEHVKQAQNAADLALAQLRYETEKNRARAEAIAQLAVVSSPKSPAKPITILKPANVPGTQQTALAGDPAASGLGANSPDTRLPPSLGQMGLSTARASGTIRIGDESIDVGASAQTQGQVSQVQWVDSQSRPVARAGSPLQPISVAPANGVLGIPAIPGIMPAPGLPQ